MASLLPDKISKVITITKTTLFEKTLVFKEVQSFIGYFSFYAKVVRLN